MTARPFTGTPGATPASTATVSTINITAQDVANEIGADLVTANPAFRGGRQHGDGIFATVAQRKQGRGHLPFRRVHVQQ